MSISVSALHLNNPFYTTDDQSKATTLSDSTAPLLDDQLPSSILPMLEKPLGNFTHSRYFKAEPDIYMTAKFDDDDDTTNGSSQSSSFRFTPASTTSSHSITSNDAEDNTKDITATPIAHIFEGGDLGDGNDTRVNVTKRPNIARPRTRSSTGSTSKQCRTSHENQPQTLKQKDQPPTAPKDKKRASKNESNNGGRKSQAGSRKRNRIAASKCRQKKKEWLSGLEASKNKLENQHKLLNNECGKLLDEVTLLKNFLVAHAACNDASIDEWIRVEASSYVRRLSQNTVPQMAVTAPAQDHQNAPKDEASQSSLDALPSTSIPRECSELSNEAMHDGMSCTDPMFTLSTTVE